MTDEVLAIRKPGFLFGHALQCQVVLHRGKRGRWRWTIVNHSTGVTWALCPVRGWETEEQAEQNARYLIESQFGLELVKGKD